MTVTAPTPRDSSYLAHPPSELAYFFDLDGTLVELAAKPTGVESDAELRRLIPELSALAGGAVAIITGRPISDIDRLFPDHRLPVAGQHGSERRNATGQLLKHAFAVSGLDAARRHLMAVVALHPALLMEDKGLSIALHYRQAPRLASYAHRVMHEAQRAAGDGFCVQKGKRVVELKPAGRDKGMAILEFMAEHPFHGRIPVFIGDDVTDEHGFAVVNAFKGVSIKVGRGRTIAGRQLANVAAVRRWLADHTDRRPGKGAATSTASTTTTSGTT